MGLPWYRTFFGPEFWALVEVEYTPERTAAEVAYLLQVLGMHPRPGRVLDLDLGCGIGRHAIPLAAAGYEVTGLDVSDWALAEARRHAEARGVSIRWECIDLLDARRRDRPPVGYPYRSRTPAPPGNHQRHLHRRRPGTARGRARGPGHPIPPASSADRPPRRRPSGPPGSGWSSASTRAKR